MRQSGEHRIGADRRAVWTALNDPEVLAKCIEGCESMVKVGDDAFVAKVRARVGPVSAVFEGSVKLADLDPPKSYRLVVSAKGGAAGFGKGEAKVTLAEDGGATILRYDVEGSVGGKLAQVGQRLIDGVAKKTADDFFDRFTAIVGPTASPAAAATSAGASTASSRQLVYGAAAAVAVALAAIVVFLLRK
jgi:carbon monoxide dehydrogenase subunit G